MLGIDGRPETEDAPQGRFTQVSVGNFHSCALGDGGDVTCWGSDRYLQPDSTTVHYTQISSGTGHTCAMTEAAD